MFDTTSHGFYRYYQPNCHSRWSMIYDLESMQWDTRNSKSFLQLKRWKQQSFWTLRQFLWSITKVNAPQGHAVLIFYLFYEKLTKGVHLLDDNTLVHKAKIAVWRHAVLWKIFIRHTVQFRFAEGILTVMSQFRQR